MARRREGLHKEVSAIFDGVPIPRSGGGEPASEHGANHGRYVPPGPGAEGDPSAPMPGTSQPAAAASKGGPVEQSAPKAALPEKQESSAAVKLEKQLPVRGMSQWQRMWEWIKSKLPASKPGVNPGRQKVMVMLAPVLFIVMIFVLMQALRSPSPRTSQAQSFGPTNLGAGSGDEIDWQIPEPYPPNLRDPMQFGSTATGPVETGELVITGIVYSEDRPAVLVANRIVHEGEKVLGATVVKIGEDTVEFEMNGKKWSQKVKR